MRDNLPGSSMSITSPTVQTAAVPTKWDAEADVIVIGAGATGLPASIVARQSGATVILVEAQADIGGHAITSGGNVALGGGSKAQKKWGITDTPDLVFKDLTDWSVVQPNGFPDYRYNDREVIRAFADNSAAACDWLADQGVVFTDQAPDTRGGISVGNSAPREMHCCAMDWPLVQTGKPVHPSLANVFTTGNGLMRPLEAAARKCGVDIRLEHRMTSIFRESPGAGPVVGIQVEHRGTTRNLRASKAIVIGTGGHTGNVNFRRMFDPRLTDEYCGLGGMPWSDQDASGEIAAMAVGASLWGFFNQTGEFGIHLTKPGTIGNQYNYRGVRWLPGSPVFEKARAAGILVQDWQNVICVNMLGQRFFDETEGNFTSNQWNSIKDYRHGNWRNAADITYKPNNWVNAAMAGIGDGYNGGGPIWAIFDADAVQRSHWYPAPPEVDIEGGFFFSANTIGELARKIVMKHQRVPMPPENLEATVARYNSFVDGGEDLDFGKPRPAYKIARGPFYAAWCTPVPHDCRAGLRIDRHCRVIDLAGQVIPSLYCGGESAGGFSLHGLARAICQGYIAGKHATNGAMSTAKPTRG